MEPLHFFFRGKLPRKDQLQRHEAVEAQLPGPVDDAHPATGYSLQQFIVAEVADSGTRRRIVASTEGDLKDFLDQPRVLGKPAKVLLRDRLFSKNWCTRSFIALGLSVRKPATSKSVSNVWYHGSRDLEGAQRGVSRCGVKGTQRVCGRMRRLERANGREAECRLPVVRRPGTGYSAGRRFSEKPPCPRSESSK